jgi:hypothetical protein
MRVNIGPYRNEVRCFRFFEKFERLLGEKICDTLALHTQSVLDFCVNRWLPGRIEEVRIDPYDTWNADHTMALIILPMLRQLKEVNHGIPFVHESDLPKHLKGTDTDIEKDDELKKRKWNYIMDEMIWAFEQIVDNDSDDRFFYDATGKTKTFDAKGYKEHQKRIDRGTRLFGKYFRALWD